MSKMELLAFDIGASNGRGILGQFDGDRLHLITIHHFDNHFSQSGEIASWDAYHILDEMKRSFAKAKAEGYSPSCFGVDTWGVDYGLLDDGGQLIQAPRAYRSATDQEMNATFEKISRRELFEKSGIASLNFNTIYQLYRRVLEGDKALQQAKTLLMMPDLFGYLLSGEKMSEYSNATTTGLLDVHTKAWMWDVMDILQIPKGIFTKVDRAGTLRGKMKADIAAELGLNEVSYAAVGTHDTASAVFAIPGQGDFAFCSSGTWSLFGVESEKPMLSEACFDANFSNEGTVQGGFRPLKNIMGLWLIQECRREWQKDGERFSWDEIVMAAREAPAFQSIVDPDYPDFFEAGDMPGKIRRYCKDTGQKAPESVGEIARCVYESLALKYRWAVERLADMQGKPVKSLNITGGGIQNKLLNQMAADSTGLKTTVGPIEGAALGNLLLQALAMGLVKNIDEARALGRRSVDTAVYEPHRDARWEDAYGRMLRYMEVKAYD